MRRAVVKALMFFILFANLSWAADMDELGIAHDAAKVFTSSVDGPGGSSDDGGLGHDGAKNVGCDHCCHGSAHYVGVPHTASPVFADNASCIPAQRVIARHSRDQEPPVPPPNI
ncbi:MAG: hypothetical protein AB1810_09125 [Pseudomonadota bacterium]